MKFSNLSEISRMKSGEKIVMLTAYDYPMARLMDGIADLILVGDSMGMVVLGYENTTKVTMNDIIRATESVSRGAKNSIIVGDLPFGSYETGEEALKNAMLLLNAGAHAVKIENQQEIAAFLVKNKIAVMGHIGLTPQTIKDFKVQGKKDKDAQKIVEQALELERAGCFSIVLECIPLELARKITQEIKIPTIGIGAGIHCDGQVLVSHDLLGLFDSFKPKFVKRYAEAGKLMKSAFERYAKEVREGEYPGDEYSFH